MYLVQCQCNLKIIAILAQDDILVCQRGFYVHSRQPEAPWCLFTETFILFPNQIFSSSFTCDFDNDIFLVTDLIPRSFQISWRSTARFCCLLSWEFVIEITGVHKIARFRIWSSVCRCRLLTPVWWRRLVGVNCNNGQNETCSVLMFLFSSYGCWFTLGSLK